jgi:hypothetical protein
MDEMEFDRTRKAIGSDALDEEERKRLLNTFTSGGGKILNEKAVKRQQPEARRSDKAAPSQVKSASVSEVKLPSELRKEQRARELERQELERRRKDAMRREASSFLARLSIKLRCAIAGLTPFGSSMVQPSAMSFFSLEMRRALIECNILGNELLVNDPELARNIKQELKNPFYVDLINRVRLLYDKQELSELLASYSEANPRSVPLESMRVPLFSLLRKLYALMPYRESYLKVVQIGIMVQQRHQKKPADLYAAKQKSIEASWRLLMDKAFPKILALVQRLEMKNIGPGHPLFEEMINFGADQRITPGGGQGDAAPATAETESKAEVAAAQVDPKEQEKQEKERKKQELAQRLFEYGLGLHRRYTPEQLRQTYDPKNEYGQAMLRDKAFLSYLLLRFFDDQFAFILTTSRLQLEPVVINGVRVNLKQDMIDAYQNIRSCYELFRAYYHDYVEYKKALDEGSNNINYVEHAKKVSMFESRRSKTGREVRMAIKSYMNRIEKLLAMLLKDMKEGGRVVVNPDEVFVMELAADQSKLMNGRKLKEIIRDTYAFAHVLGKRLESGDLYGGVLELSDDDFQASTQNSSNPVPPPEDEASDSIPDPEKSSGAL